MASALPSKVLIFGSTGVIGKYITGAILRAQGQGALPSLASVAIFTSPATAANPAKRTLLDAWRRQGLGVVTGDLHSAADVRRAYEGVDTVVSCLGRTALLEQLELLRLAEQSASVRWFFPSEYGTDIEYDATSPAEKPHQNKLKVRACARDELKRVRVTYVVTGPYADMFLEFKPGFELGGGFDAKKHEAVLVGDGSDRIGFTTMPDVGKFVAAALAHPEASAGKALKVQSFVTTPQELLAEFEKQTGANFDVKYTSKDQLREVEQKSWQEGNPGAALFTLRRIWAEGKTLYEKTDNETLQVSPGDLETVSDVVGRAVRGEGY